MIRLLGAPKCARLCGVSRRTLNNWNNKPELGFPPPVHINQRRYYDQAAVQAWLEAKLSGAPFQPEAAETSVVLIEPEPRKKSTMIDRRNATEITEA
jgi:predicted DNA-binding transcriptional regulator AlpA